MSSSVAAATRIHYPRFTASQWQELEHQALIFKYMMAGIPVPLDLLHPIRESIDSSRFFHHPSLNYCSFYGKKIDPEPGRCRRTDGKKWRCSKDSYPDSKYCERHMHRGRNRSRKPVEMQNISQSSSTAAHLAVPTGGMGTIPSNFSNVPHPISNSHGSHSSPLQIDIASYGIGNKNYRYLDGTKGEADAHSFFSEVSGSARRLGLDSAVAVDGSWSLMSSNMPSLPSAKDRTISIWDSNYQQYQALQNLEPVSAAVSKQQQHRFFGTEFGPPKPIKQEGRSLRPFLDEWPRNRET